MFPQSKSKSSEDAPKMNGSGPSPSVVASPKRHPLIHSGTSINCSSPSSRNPFRSAGGSRAPGCTTCSQPQSLDGSSSNGDGAVERPRLLPEVFVFPEGGGSPERPNSASFVTKAPPCGLSLGVPPGDLPITPEEPCGGDITSGVSSGGSSSGTSGTNGGNSDMSGVKMRRKMLAQRHSTAGGGKFFDRADLSETKPAFFISKA